MGRDRCHLVAAAEIAGILLTSATRFYNSSQAKLPRWQRWCSTSEIVNYFLYSETTENLHFSTINLHSVIPHYCFFGLKVSNIKIMTTTSKANIMFKSSLLSLRTTVQGKHKWGNWGIVFNTMCLSHGTCPLVVSW